jgi:hypothetical protein
MERRLTMRRNILDSPLTSSFSIASTALGESCELLMARAAKAFFTAEIAWRHVSRPQAWGVPKKHMPLV